MIRKNLFSILVALIMLYLSLANSERFEKIYHMHIPYIDKIVHFGMYFFLMSVMIAENRKNLKEDRNLYILALIPLSYGILMEIMQLVLTDGRSASFYDAVSNAAGILVSVLLWLLIKPLIRTGNIVR